MKSDREMMFGDGLECEQGHLYHIWRFQILMAAILDFFKGLTHDFGSEINKK